MIIFLDVYSFISPTREDVHELRSVETEFPATAFNDQISSEKTLSCEPLVSSLKNEIDFKISFDDSDDEDYTVIYFDDLEFFKDFENEFLAIVYNDAPTSKSYFLTELILSPQHIDEIDLKKATSLSEYNEEEQNVLFFNDLFPFNIIHPNDLKSKKDNDDNEIDIIQSSGDIALPPRDQKHQYLRDAQGDSLFTSRAWRRLFDIRGPLVHELILEFFSTFRFGEAILDLDMPRALQFQLGGARRRLSWSARQIPDKGDLRDYWIRISLAGDFLSTALSYTYIKDPILRLCHRYLRLFAAGRKSGALISRGQFVARLAEHFGLLTEERLRGLTVIAPALLVIDMDELVRLQICVEIDDTWDWVAQGPERQPDAAAGAPGVAQDAPVVDEGYQVIPAPVQAPPPSPAAARTMPQRMARLEEDVHEIRGALAKQREVIGAMARDFSRFTVWVTSGIAQLLDSARVTYMPYFETCIPYQRRVRQRNDEASTSTAQTKTGSKFSTIAREYISETSTDPVKEISTDTGGEITNLEILKCWSPETSRRLFNTNACSINLHG
ncbi:hypothetical protein Tco_0759259 [Tanacetum coccineum]